MVRAVKGSVSIPVIVGGGITDSALARGLCSAGADIIVTGTLVENGDFETPLRAVVEAVHGSEANP